MILTDILDHEHFSGVPATGLVVCSHPTFSKGLSFSDHFKIGSFQEFKGMHWCCESEIGTNSLIEHDFDAEDISSVKYQQFPVHEVHKIAILGILVISSLSSF